MTHPTLLESLDAIQKRVEAATREWKAGIHQNDWGLNCLSDLRATGPNHEKNTPKNRRLVKADAELIAHAPTDLANLVKALRVAERALKYYAEDSAYKEKNYLMISSNFKSDNCAIRARTEMAKILAGDAA